RWSSPGVVAGMHRVGRQPSPQAPLGWGKALLSTRGWQGRRGTLGAHLRGSFPGVPLGCLAPAQLAAASGPPAYSGWVRAPPPPVEVCGVLLAFSADQL